MFGILTRSRWSRNTIEDLLMRDNYFIPYKVKVFEGELVREEDLMTLKMRFWTPFSQQSTV